MPVAVPDSAAPCVSVLMVVHGHGRVAVDAIQALVEHTPEPFELIVVDNASPDDSLDHLRSIEGITLVESEVNVGFGQGNNLAAEIARAPVLVLLNPDTRVRAGWLPPLLRRLDVADVGAVAPVLVSVTGEVAEAGAVVDRWGMTAPRGGRDFDRSVSPPREAVPVDYASAACLAIRADLFRELGGFDAAYHLAYYEDADLCFRLWRRGAEVWCEPASRVEHARGGGGDPSTAVELWNRNRSVFLTKWRDELARRPGLTEPGGVRRLQTWRRSSSGPSGRELRVVLTAWAVVCILGLVLLERLRAPRTFFFDEWNFVLLRRGALLDDLLEPHNGHLSILPALAYRIAFSVVGLDHYRPYRIAGLLVHAGVATAVLLYVRRRVGSVVAVCAGAVVLMLGSGWQNILWPFQIGFMGSVLGAVVAWIALDRRTPTGDVVAATALGVALGCSGVGIAIAAGTVLRIACRRDWLRLVRVTVPPLLVYLVWYLAYGASQGSSDNIPLIPRYGVDAAASAAGGLLGRDLLWGRLLIGALVATVLVLAVQRKVTAAVVAPLGTAAVNWVLTAYSRASLGEPGASRYTYVGAVMLVLVIAELLPLARRRPATTAAIGFAALSIWGNWHLLEGGARFLRETTAVTRSELRAMEWARAIVAPDYRPDDVRMPQVSAGVYFEAVDDLGSPAASDAEVAVAAPATRAEVDRVSLQAAAVALTPAPSTDADPTAGDCTMAPVGSEGAAQMEVTIRTGDEIVMTASSASVEVRPRRYADHVGDGPFAIVSPGETRFVTFPPDDAPVQEWLIELRSAGPFGVCGTAASISSG